VSEDNDDRTTVPGRRRMPIDGRMVAMEARVGQLEQQMAILRPVVAVVTVALFVILGALAMSAWRFQHP
jgi:hypothetical protein